MEAKQKINNSILQRGTGTGNGEGESPAEANDRSVRTIASGRPSYSGEGTGSLTGVSRAVEGSAKDLHKRFNRTLHMRDEEDLLRSPPPGPSGQGRGDFTTVRSKRSLKRERVKLKKQNRVSEQPIVFQQPGGGTSTAAEGSELVRLPKVKRYSTDPDEHRPAKRRTQRAQDGPRESAKGLSDLAVAIHRADGNMVDANLAEVIRSRISSLILEAGRAQEDSDKLNFATSGLVSEGFFMVTPMNALARDWLLSCDLGDYNGVQIRLSRIDRSRVAVWIPGAKKVEDPLEYLQIQNRNRSELQIHKWSLIVRESLPLGERLIVGVPQEVCQLFGDEGVWLYFQVTKVQAKLLKSRKKTDTPDVDMNDTTQCPPTSATGGDLGRASSLRAIPSEVEVPVGTVVPPHSALPERESVEQRARLESTSVPSRTNTCDAEKRAGPLTGNRYGPLH